jgi:hypothetical protein
MKLRHAIISAGTGKKLDVEYRSFSCQEDKSELWRRVDG